MFAFVVDRPDLAKRSSSEKAAAVLASAPPG